MSVVRSAAEREGYTVEGFAPTSRAAQKLGEGSPMAACHAVGGSWLAMSVDGYRRTAQLARKPASKSAPIT
jgi:hypothetical protein